MGALARAVKSPDAQAFVSGLINEHEKMIQYAVSIGVPLAVGTDCVLPDPGYLAAYHAELSYFEQAGISRNEVEKIACEGGARLLGLNT